ncbi:MAG: class I SAM-dependent methyltransferase [Candidatus Buchananbacteria bacterium]
MKPLLAQKIQQQVQADYNTIAQDWNATRQNLWPEFLPLQKYLLTNTKILDFGCGNGRLAPFFANYNINYTGVDITANLIAQAQHNFPQNVFLTVTPAAEQPLPFAEQTFDQIWSIAVYHQIPSRALRQKTLQELNRLLKPKGQLIITVWYLYQPKYWRLILKSFLKKIFFNSPLDFGDVFVPWQNITSRYYHAFTKLGLTKEFIQAGLKPKILPLHRQNKLVGWAVVVQK